MRHELVEQLVALEVFGVGLMEREQGAATLVAGRHAGELLDQVEALEVEDRVDERRDEAGLVAEVITDEGRVLGGLVGDVDEGERAKTVAGQHAFGGVEDARRCRRQMRRWVLDRYLVPRQARLPFVGPRGAPYGDYPEDIHRPPGAPLAA